MPEKVVSNTSDASTKNEHNIQGMGQDIFSLSTSPFDAMQESAASYHRHKLSLCLSHHQFLSQVLAGLHYQSLQAEAKGIAETVSEVNCASQQL